MYYVWLDYTHCCCSFTANYLHYSNIKTHKWESGPYCTETVSETRYKHNDELVISTSVSFHCMLRDLAQQLFLPRSLEKLSVGRCLQWCADLGWEELITPFLLCQPSAHKVTISSSLTPIVHSSALELISAWHCSCKLCKIATALVIWTYLLLLWRLRMYLASFVV